MTSMYKSDCMCLIAFFKYTVMNGLTTSHMGDTCHSSFLLLLSIDIIFILVTIYSLEPKLLLDPLNSKIMEISSR